jgi:hypothetical protein
MGDIGRRVFVGAVGGGHLGIQLGECICTLPEVQVRMDRRGEPDRQRSNLLDRVTGQ